MPTPVIDLRSLQNPVAGLIELDSGRHEVRKLNAEQYQAALRMDKCEDPDAAIEASVQIVLGCMPTTPEAQVRKFSPELLMAIIGLASQGIEAVEKMFPNAEGPETRSTSPG